MQRKTLALAVTLALAATSFQANAQDARDAELAALKQQLAELATKVQELESRTDAQSEVNVDTATQLDNLSNNVAKVETKGGIKITSADKNFEASLGGRIHFDAYGFDHDVAATTDTTEFRRARLTLSGKAYGWEYKVENDFAAGSNLDGFRDLYIASQEGVDSHEYQRRRVSGHDTSITQYGSEVKAGGNLTATAGQDLSIVASEIEARRDQALQAMALAFTHPRIVLEPGGAVALAAALFAPDLP